ncbi:MAG TPA: DUF3857 domain-containing protein, partial [Flavobacteriaceae bacterium]|nr:DUF3857 domain-containing protein [Flavobacteriaceae bacterium]
MNIKNILSVFLILITSHLYSQEELYIASTISPDLKKNANAVIRLDETKINIESIRNLKHSYKRIITILNKNGDNDLDTYVYYDNKIRVKSLKAIVYDKNGNEINKFKKSNFKDVAAVSSFSLYEDSRVKYLDYTPINYPYTVEFIYETETNNTAWIPFWRPLEGYYLSTEKSTFEVVYDSEVGINIKENNFSDFNINGKNNEGLLSYTAENLKAIKPEDLSPSFREFTP